MSLNDDIRNEIKKLTKEYLQAKGLRVEMYTKYCEQYCKTHIGCQECESNKGCDSMKRLTQIIFENTTKEPQSFYDFLEQQFKIEAEVKRFLHSLKLENSDKIDGVKLD